MSTFEHRCEIRLLYLLKILILTIAVCELRRGFALQCFHYAVKTPCAFAMRMLIYIVGVVVIERARVIGARQFSAMCFGATERVYNAS